MIDAGIIREVAVVFFLGRAERGRASQVRLHDGIARACPSFLRQQHGRRRRGMFALSSWAKGCCAMRQGAFDAGAAKHRPDEEPVEGPSRTVPSWLSSFSDVLGAWVLAVDRQRWSWELESRVGTGDGHGRLPNGLHLSSRILCLPSLLLNRYHLESLIRRICRRTVHSGKVAKILFGKQVPTLFLHLHTFLRFLEGTSKFWPQDAGG